MDAIAQEEFALEVAMTVQTALRQAMGRYIQSIPVDEDTSPEGLICQAWADK